MKFAYDINNNRITPSKNEIGFCPICGEKLISKCGNINTHHWSHISNSQCEYSKYNTMSDWHNFYQNLVNDKMTEVIVEKNNIKKIADIYIPMNMFKQPAIVELQHSTISSQEVEIREKHYENMIWLFDFTNKKIDIYNVNKIDVKTNRKYTTNYKEFKCNYMKKTLYSCKKPVLIDDGHRIHLLLGKKYLYSFDRQQIINIMKTNIKLLYPTIIKKYNDLMIEIKS